MKIFKKKFLTDSTNFTKFNISITIPFSPAWTAEHTAAQKLIVGKEDEKLPEALSKIQGDINAFHGTDKMDDINGWLTGGSDVNLLFYAAGYGNWPAMEALLGERSLDVTKSNSFGVNVLHVLGSAKTNQAEMAELCIKNIELSGNVRKLAKFVNKSTKIGELRY